jgi:hypothetical protein
VKTDQLPITEYSGGGAPPAPAITGATDNAEGQNQWYWQARELSQAYNVLVYLDPHKRQHYWHSVDCVEVHIPSVASPFAITAWGEGNQWHLNPVNTLPAGRQHDLRRLFNHLHHIASDAGRRGVDERTVRYAEGIWQTASHAIGSTLTVPSAANTPDGEILMRWTSGDHLLDVTVQPAGDTEWFYWNRRDDASWDLTVAASSDLPPEVISKLRLIARLKSGTVETPSAAGG